MVLLLQALNGYMRQILMCAFKMFWVLGDGDAEKERWFKLALYYYYVAVQKPRRMSLVIPSTCTMPLLSITSLYYTVVCDCHFYSATLSDAYYLYVEFSRF